jgi:hypothetical protein
MAHNLARALGCRIIFIPFDFQTDAEQKQNSSDKTQARLLPMIEALNKNMIDIAMSCVYVSLDRIQKVDFTDTYMEIHPAFIVKDYLKDEYSSFKKVADNPSLKIAILKGNAYKSELEKRVGKKRVVVLDSYVEFFEGRKKADVLFHSAEQGSTWALLYPEYTVVVLKGVHASTGVAYAIAKGDLAFLEYLNYWLKIEKWNGVTDRNYDYWVLGKVPGIRKPRWCILRDVLHWID